MGECGQTVVEPSEEVVSRFVGFLYWQLFRLCRWVVFEVDDNEYVDLLGEIEIEPNRTAPEMRGTDQSG